MGREENLEKGTDAGIPKTYCKQNVSAGSS